MTSRHYSPRSVTIVATELTWMVASLALVISLDIARQRGGLPVERIVLQSAVAALLYVAGFYYADAYNFADSQMRREVVTRVLRAFSLLSVAFGLIFLCTTWLEFHPTLALIHLAVTTVFAIVLRTHIDAVLARYGVLTRIVIVGTGPEARGLVEQMFHKRQYGQDVACLVTTADVSSSMEFRANPGGRTLPVIMAASLVPYVKQHRITRILVATADLGSALPVDALLHCKAEGYQVEDGHTFYERLMGRISIADLSPQWLIFSDGFTRSASARAIKRTVDVVAATCLLVLTAPLCALVALAIKLEDRGPVLYQQARVGQGGAIFTLRKFRSMGVNAEADTGPKWAEYDDPRVTRVGRWIRALRIDEIPQAWNALRGDMSFVGPRPERPEFVATLCQQIPFYKYRHAVRPGITGWAQVHLPYAATVDDSREKLEHDLYYLKNFSLLMDLYILFRTGKIILFGWGSR